MQTLSLSQIAKVSSGQGAPQGDDNFDHIGIPFIKAGNLDQLLSTNDEYLSCKLVNESIAKKYKLELFPKNAIVFAKSGMSATKGRVYMLNNDSYVVNHLAVISPEKNLVEPSYLRYFLIKFSPTNLIKDNAYPSIRLSDISKISVPIPSVEEQKKIVKILNQADSLRQKRKQSLVLLEKYLNSVFFDMFGDLVKNTMGWKVYKLEEIANIVSGVTKGRKLDKNKIVTVPYMRVANVQDGRIDLTDVKEIEAIPSDIDKYKLEAGDLLLTEGGDPDKLGRGGVWKGQIEPCIHQNHIFRVRLDKKFAVPEFVSAQIGSAYGKRYFLQSAKQTTGIATINITQLKNLPVFLPPIDLQNRFSEIVNKIEILKQKMIEQSEQFDMEFQSLMQKSFETS